MQIFVVGELKFGKLPAYLSELVTYRRDINSYPTRSIDNFHLKLKQSVRAKCYLLYKGLNEFNGLPTEIKSEAIERTFIRKLIAHVKVAVPV